MELKDKLAAYLDVDPARILSCRDYGERVAYVIDNGIKGCPKHWLDAGELKAPEPEPLPRIDAPQPIITRAARQLMDERGITADQFGDVERITIHDVREVIE